LAVTRVEEIDAGCIATRPGEAGDKAKLDREKAGAALRHLYVAPGTGTKSIIASSRRPAPQSPPHTPRWTSTLIPRSRPPEGGVSFLDTGSRLKALKSVQRAFRRPDRR
jgi:hypothetical protein